MVWVNGVKKIGCVDACEGFGVFCKERVELLLLGWMSYVLEILL